ncbi:MAG TPA: hypothetical protein VGU20_09635 [Stellaceae bacterium]|nr:hypothetical protein [Stellaceae bacterium]
MLSTDGYIYLRIDDPLCAWNTYRGVIASANVITTQPGCLSVWVAATIRRDARSSRVIRECNLEKVRRQRYSDKVSRSWGIYTCIDKESADRVQSLGEPHMTTENRAEINLSEARRTSTHDLNWITYHSDDIDSSWMDAYWTGEECPGHAPIWEKLVDGRVIVLGTQLREKAYSLVKAQFPESLCLMEIARIAAWVGSDVGSIAAFIIAKDDSFAVDYYLNMEEANDPTFVKKVADYMRLQPVNREDIDPFISKGTFGSTPDLRCYSLLKLKAELPYLADLL